MDEYINDRKYSMEIIIFPSEMFIFLCMSVNQTCTGTFINISK